jgi:hypothetical protein
MGTPASVSEQLIWFREALVELVAERKRIQKLEQDLLSEGISHQEAKRRIESLETECARLRSDPEPEELVSAAQLRARITAAGGKVFGHAVRVEAADGRCFTASGNVREELVEKALAFVEELPDAAPVAPVFGTSGAAERVAEYTARYVPGTGEVQTTSTPGACVDLDPDLSATTAALPSLDEAELVPAPMVDVLHVPIGGDSVYPRPNPEDAEPEPSCEFCRYEDTDGDDEPCASCTCSHSLRDNFEPKPEPEPAPVVSEPILGMSRDRVWAILRRDFQAPWWVVVIGTLCCDPWPLIRSAAIHAECLTADDRITGVAPQEQGGGE